LIIDEKQKNCATVHPVHTVNQHKLFVSDFLRHSVVYFVSSDEAWLLTVAVRLLTFVIFTVRLISSFICKYVFLNFHRCWWWTV